MFVSYISIFFPFSFKSHQFLFILIHSFLNIIPSFVKWYYIYRFIYGYCTIDITPQYTIYMCVLVVQSCLTFCDSMDCSPTGYFVHGILQAKILEWVAIPFSTGSSQPRGQIWVSCIAGRFFTVCAIRETHIYTHTHTHIYTYIYMYMIL